MAIDISVTVKGHTRAEQEIKGVGNRGQAAGPALQAIAKFVIETEEQQFETKGAWGGYNGGAWKPLAPSTLARKAAKGQPTSEPLRESGRLMRSLTTAKGADQTWQVTSTMMRIGSKRATAGYAERGAKNRPKRPVIVWTKRETTKAKKTIAHYIRTGDVVRPRVR